MGLAAKIKESASKFVITDEMRLQNDSIYTRLVRELLEKMAGAAVVFAELLDESYADLTSNTLFSTLESLSRPDTGLHFQALKVLANELIAKGAEEYQEPQFSATHLSYLDPASNLLVRIDITDDVTFQKASVQIGEPNPDRPLLIAQYDDQPGKPIIDSDYYQNGVRTQYSLSHNLSPKGLSFLRQTLNTQLEVREFKGGTGKDTDYNGTVSDPSISPDEWLQKIVNHLNRN